MGVSKFVQHCNFTKTFFENHFTYFRKLSVFFSTRELLSSIGSAHFVEFDAAGQNKIVNSRTEEEL